MIWCSVFRGTERQNGIENKKVKTIIRNNNHFIRLFRMCALCGIFVLSIHLSIEMAITFAASWRMTGLQKKNECTKNNEKKIKYEHESTQNEFYLITIHAISSSFFFLDFLIARLLGMVGNFFCNTKKEALFCWKIVKHFPLWCTWSFIFWYSEEKIQVLIGKRSHSFYKKKLHKKRQQNEFIIQFAFYYHFEFWVSSFVYIQV